MKTDGRIAGAWCVAVVAVMCFAFSATARASSHTSLMSFNLGSYSAINLASASHMESSPEKHDGLCKHGCSVSVAEGGSPALYLLLAGVSCIGAVVFRMQRRRARKAV